MENGSSGEANSRWLEIYLAKFWNHVQNAVVSETIQFESNRECEENQLLCIDFHESSAC